MDAAAGAANTRMRSDDAGARVKEEWTGAWKKGFPSVGRDEAVLACGEKRTRECPATDRYGEAILASPALVRLVNWSHSR